MAIEIQTPPIIIRVGSYANLPPSDLTPAEVQQLKDDIAAEQNKALGDLANVDTSGAVDGNALVYDADTSEWVPGEPAKQLQMQQGDTPETLFGPVNVVDARNGLAVWQAGSGGTVGVIEPIYGTGTNTIARGNHTHALRVDTQLTFSASGSFSSGTRTLISGNVTGLDTTKTYVLKGVLDVHLRGDGAGAGYTRPRITINGNGVDMPERPRNVAGVQPCYTMRHPGVTVSGVSSVAVSATIAYSEGDATWVGGGALTISIESNR